MMQPYPFSYFPNFRRPHPYYYNLHNSNVNMVKDRQNPCFPSVSSNQKQGNFDCSSNGQKSKDCKSNNIENIQSDSEECFEIFGLKLHFDDLLIIALLFFLYQENVKDTYLYIALILLLLS